MMGDAAVRKEGASPDFISRSGEWVILIKITHSRMLALSPGLLTLSGDAAHMIAPARARFVKTSKLSTRFIFWRNECHVLEEVSREKCSFIQFLRCKVRIFFILKRKETNNHLPYGGTEAIF
jgi:hypothetical protein